MPEVYNFLPCFIRFCFIYQYFLLAFRGLHVVILGRLALILWKQISTNLWKLLKLFRDNLQFGASLGGNIFGKRTCPIVGQTFSRIVKISFRLEFLKGSVHGSFDWVDFGQLRNAIHHLSLFLCLIWFWNNKDIPYLLNPRSYFKFPRITF